MKLKNKFDAMVEIERCVCELDNLRKILYINSDEDKKFYGLLRQLDNCIEIIISEDNFERIKSLERVKKE